MPPETDMSGGATPFRGARITLVAGTRDQYVTDEIWYAEQARLDAAKVPYDAIRFEGGHVISRTAFPLLATGGAGGSEGAR